MESSIVAKFEELTDKYSHYIGDSLSDFEMVSGRSVILPNDIKPMLEAAYNMALADKQLPISEYPKDSSPIVIRWHIIWKCYVSVYYHTGFGPQGCDWLTATKDNTWPEAAFTPYFIIPTPTNHDKD